MPVALTIAPADVQQHIPSKMNRNPTALDRAHEKEMKQISRCISFRKQ